jgi:hypothetical protein
MCFSPPSAPSSHASVCVHRADPLRNSQAIELLNEPWTTAIGGPIQFSTLKQFYLDSYAHLRNTVGFNGLVVMSDGWSNSEWNGFMSPPSWQDVYFDVHLYHCFGGQRDKQNPWNNVNYTCDHDLPMLNGLTQRDWTIVGEFSLCVSHPPASNATTQWAKAFLSSQLTAYGAAGPNAANGPAKGAFFWNFKIEGGSVDWDYLEGLRRGWVPRTPAEWDADGCSDSRPSPNRNPRSPHKRTKPLVEHGRDAYYILFDYDVEAPSWPKGFEQYSLFVASPQNMTSTLVDKVRRTIPGSKVVLYWDSQDVPIRHGCSSGHVMGDKPGRNCSTSYRCGKGKWTDEINKVFESRLALRQLHDDGRDPTVICTYPGLARYVPCRESVEIVTKLITRWVTETAFDGVYLDMSLRSSLYATVAREQLPQFGKVDANGDSRPDSLDDIIDQYVAWRPVLSHELRTRLPSHIIIGNSAGALSDPSFSGLTIEMEACTDLSRCADALVAQHEASSALSAPQNSIMWLTHAESVPPKVQCERLARLQKELPWVMGGTDFFDGSHIVCS